MDNSGWVFLDKSSGLFSRTAGARVARMFDVRTVGHIGTLDPMATGVLPIALGTATKMIPFIEEIGPSDKEYLFSMQFGFQTDTLDITGRIVRQDDFVPELDSVLAVLPSFVGKISQIPPAFSAVQVFGVAHTSWHVWDAMLHLPRERLKFLLWNLWGAAMRHGNFAQCAAVGHTSAPWHGILRLRPGPWPRLI